MRKISIASLSVLLAIPIAAWSQQVTSASVAVLTLEQAITLALRENHLVKNAELAEDALAATRTLRLPSTHLYTLVSQQFVKQESTLNNPFSNIVPGVGPFFSIGTRTKPTVTIAGLIVQPLSQQYRIGLDIKQAGLARDVESEKLRQVRQSTVDEVKRTYYGILQTQTALYSLQEAIRLYRELDRVTGDYVAQQVALKSDNRRASYFCQGRNST
jgi:outer membrane protein